MRASLPRKGSGMVQSEGNNSPRLATVVILRS